MKWARWLGFAVLCGWQASVWLVPPADAGPSTLGRIALGCLLVAIVSAAALAWRREGFKEKGWLGIAGSAVMLIGAPAVLLRYASEYSTDTNVAIVFALMPVVVVLMWSALSNEDMGLSALVPALVGAAGVLVVLPYELPVSGKAWVALAEAFGAMVTSACGAVLLNRLASRRRVAGVLLAGALANLAVLSMCGAWSGTAAFGTWSLSVWIVIVAQAGMVALTLWLAGSISAVVFSARFLVVPLVTIVEGAVLLRPGVDTRLVVGLVLLAAGITWLFASDGRVDGKVLSLR